MGKTVRQNVWQLAIRLFACFVGLLAANAWAMPCDVYTQLKSAQRQIYEGTRLVDSAMVSIPDTLLPAWRKQGFSVRYSIGLDICSGGLDQTLWLPRVGAPYQILINGAAVLPVHPVNAGSWFTSESDRTLNGRASALFALPSGTQQVQVALQTVPYIPGGLVRVARGSYATMLPLQLWEYQAQVGGMHTVSLVIFFVGLTVILVWTAGRRDKLLLWFGLMCLSWGMRGVLFSSDVLYLSPLVFEQLNPLTVCIFAAFCAQTTLVLVGKSSVRGGVALTLMVMGSLSALWLSFELGSGAQQVRSMAYAVTMLVLTALPVLIWRERQQLGVWRAAMIVFGFAVLLAASLHDILMIAGVLSWDRWSMALYGFSTVLLAYAVVCLLYIVRALNVAETANTLLEVKVQEKTKALEQSYALLRETESNQARNDERSRLLREMHDGLGAQLMTAMRGLERGALDQAGAAAVLQDGIDDLRMLMDNSDPSATLTERLAAWRHRWDDRLGALGLQLVWKLGDGIDQMPIAGDTALQLLRIVQEACTNVIKHANASTIWLSVERDRDGEKTVLRIEVRDNGQGLSDQPVRPAARGLANMRYRAEHIGATLKLSNAAAPESGTCLRLEMPVQATSPRRAASIVASARDEIPNLR